MAATDTLYRNQKTLNWIFAASCVAMLVSVLWMFADDFNRPYKKDQQVFRTVEAELNKRTALALAPDEQLQKDMVASEAAVVKARELVAQLKGKVDAAVVSKLPGKAKLETRLQNTKADYDSLISYFNIAVDKGGSDSDAAKKFKAEAGALLKPMDEMRIELEKLNDELASVGKQEFEVGGTKTSLESAEAKLKELEANHKKLTGDFDRFIKLTSQKRWGFGDTFRGLPVIDGFAPPVKIKQTFHEDLPIDYGGFKYVTRYDRCTTCHLGIDKPAMDRETLARLTVDPNKDDSLQKQFANAKAALDERQKANRDQRQDLNLLSSRDLKPELVNLTPAQVSMFAAHPRLDLFVDANSRHPMEKFGCSICHQGQGSATGFVDATHTPNDHPTMNRWKDDHNWRSIHFWDFPMYPTRFTESSCLKCHHDVNSLITGSVRNEAPMLTKGYNLVRELGCFGCHEIHGNKGGRAVGPDMRLEPEPPLELLSPAERAKRLEDTANPPGDLRKVGPSLYRIAQKTNPDWSARWLKAPRAFRPDTKMPHFYLQANNVPEALPEDQKKFPDAEIQSVTKYLFEKSRSYSQNKALPKAPDAPKDDAARTAQAERGRHLFASKGCMACHMHERMETAGPAASDGKPQPSLVGDSHFGPELSRIAAKIDSNTGRDWLVQWLLDPTVHSPRTLMPSVHLTTTEAADIAGWLLAQTPKADPEWDAVQVDKPETTTLQAMARMYLKKSGLTTRQVNEVLQGGFAKDELAHRPAEADEHELASPISDDKLMMYIGKKAISNLGCYACHNIPGFDQAKPIGVALNDWGRKETERIAFEDGASYVEDHYKVIESWKPEGEDAGHAEKSHAGGPRKKPLERHAPYDTSAHPSFERYFADMLHHGHQNRAGFLHLKLMSPRSYDYNRIRDWNDRTRMPQFKFARTRKKEGESDADFKARADREEAQAREAVMTFVLGLVAEPIPTKFVHQPTGDRLAEIRGFGVLQKYNCNSCHLVRPGMFELNIGSTPVKLADGTMKKANELTMEQLIAAHNFVVENEASDPKDPKPDPFPDHVAWRGAPPPTGADRLVARGLVSVIGEANYLRLSEALSFRIPDGDTGKTKVATIPANVSAPLAIVPETMRQVAGPFGGLFALQLKRYLTEWDAKVYGDVQPLNGLSDDSGQALNGYAALPPSLLFEGERVQPEWLYQFLLNPKPIRKIPPLQMPKFSLSPDESMTLVNYFIAVNRSNNPALGLTGPYDQIEQKDEAYLKKMTKEYVERLKANNLFDERVKELKPVWALAARESLANAERRLALLKAAGEETKLKDVQTEIDSLKSQLGANDFPSQKARWEEHEAYIADAWKLVNYKEAQCLLCHQIGPAMPNEYRAPNLHQAAERLRPEWSKRWIAHPQRLNPYPSLMLPLYKPAEAKKHEENRVFIGSPMDQVKATRDLLMVFPQVADWPVIRFRVGPTAFGSSPAAAAPPPPTIPPPAGAEKPK